MKTSCLIALLALGVTAAAEEFAWQSLPDYSFAGYRHGKDPITVINPKIFNVLDYGAKPDDQVSDTAAIQRAIDAAGAAGGGVVYLPHGRYLTNTERGGEELISVKSDNIVIRGDGAQKGGTEIYQVHPFLNGKMDDPTRMHLKKSLLMIGHPEAEKPLLSQSVVANVTAPAAPGDLKLTVDNASGFNPGDMISLAAKNRAIIDALTLPYKIEPEWTTTTGNQAVTAELHQIAAIDGNELIFTEPVLYPVKPEHGWELRRAKLLTNVGVEDIAFTGNHYAPYIHHRSDRDDVGWAAIKMKGVSDSWVRRCAFININQAVYMGLSRQCSLLNIIIAGNPGHHIPRGAYLNYGLFGGFIDDRAGFSHGPSVSGASVGTVFYRCDSAGSIDSHGGRPYYSLFDCNSGGKIDSSGGLRDYPQHLSQLIIWNFCNTAPGVMHYNFWEPGKNNRFVKPVIIGFHGNPAEFAPDSVGLLVSPGQAVKPDSLYEAQLSRRYGKLPEWLSEVKRQNEVMQKMELPDYTVLGDPMKPGYVYSQRFDLIGLMRELCGVSLQMYGSVPFELAAEPAHLEMTGDQVRLGHVIYMLMNVIGRENIRIGNQISAQAANGNVTIILSSGKLTKPAKLDAGGHLAAARALAAPLRGTIDISENNHQIIIRLELPEKGQSL